MGRRNIYVREEDEVIWDKASALAGDESMSQIIARALEAYVRSREGAPLAWLTVEVEDPGGHTSTKKFSGRWLIIDFKSDHEADVQHPLTGEFTSHGQSHTHWSVAETAKGQIVFWATPDNDDRKLYVYKDLDQAEGHGIPADVVSAAAAKLGLERAELLDI